MLMTKLFKTRSLIGLGFLLSGFATLCVSQASAGNSSSTVEVSRTDRDVAGSLITVNGTVTDRSGNAVKDATVLLLFDHMPLKSAGVPIIRADSSGKFVTELPPGNYRLCVDTVIVRPSNCTDAKLTADQGFVDISLKAVFVDGPRQTSIETLRARLMKLAGETAVDCGRVEIDSDPAWANRCIQDFIKRSKPAYVQYRVLSNDSVAAEALAADGAGQVYRVVFDSIGIGSPPGAVNEDEGYTFVQRCRLPLRLQEKDHKVTCVLEGQAVQ